MNEQNINVQNEVEAASEVKQKTSWLFNLTKRDIVFGFIIGLVTILFSTLSLCGDFRVGYTVTSTLFTLFFSIYNKSLVNFHITTENNARKRIFEKVFYNPVWMFCLKMG